MLLKLAILVAVLVGMKQSKSQDITLELQNEFSPNFNGTNAMFGYDIAMDDEHAIIAAPYDSSVFVYTYNTTNDSWSRTQKIYPMGSGFTYSTNNNHNNNDSDSDNEFFGWSVGLFENDFIIGGSNFGQAFIFHLNETNEQWYQSDVLYCEDDDSFNSSIDCDFSTFGTSVEITKNYAIIGDYNSGVSHIYMKNNKNNESWIKSQIIYPTYYDDEEDESFSDCFGFDVSISYESAIIGAPCKDVISSLTGQNSGRAFIFELNKTTMMWSQIIMVQGSGDDHDAFGYSVGIDESSGLAVVGSAGTIGSVYVYHKKDTNSSSSVKYNNTTTGNWTELMIIEPSESETSFYGSSVSIYNKTFAVGGYASDNYQGDVYVYQLDSEFDELYARVTEPSQYFGYSVYVFDNILIVGAIGNDSCYSYYISFDIDDEDELILPDPLSISFDGGKFLYGFIAAVCPLFVGFVLEKKLSGKLRCIFNENVVRHYEFSVFSGLCACLFFTDSISTLGFSYLLWFRVLGLCSSSLFGSRVFIDIFSCLCGWCCKISIDRSFTMDITVFVSISMVVIKVYTMIVIISCSYLIPRYINRYIVVVVLIWCILSLVIPVCQAWRHYSTHYYEYKMTLVAKDLIEHLTGKSQTDLTIASISKIVRHAIHKKDGFFLLAECVRAQNKSLELRFVSKAPGSNICTKGSKDDIMNYVCDESTVEEIKNALKDDSTLKIDCEQLEFYLYANRYGGVSICGNSRCLYYRRTTSTEKFIQKVIAHDYNGVDTTLKLKDCNINGKDEKTGKTALIIACEKQYEDIVHKLLSYERGKFDMSISDKYSKKSLNFASNRQYKDMAQKLMPYKRVKCNVNITDKEEKSALFYTVDRESNINQNIFNMLVSHPDINNNDGKDILVPLCKYNHWKFLKRVCEDANKYFVKEDLLSPLMHAVANYSVQCIKELCKHESKISAESFSRCIIFCIYLCSSFEILQTLLITQLFDKLAIMNWGQVESNEYLTYLKVLSKDGAIEKLFEHKGEIYEDIHQYVDDYVSPKWSRNDSCVESIKTLLIYCRNGDFRGLEDFLAKDKSVNNSISKSDTDLDNKEEMSQEQDFESNVDVNETDTTSTLIENKWLLDKQLGEGAFGLVYKAMPVGIKNNSNVKYVALKFILRPKENEKNEAQTTQLVRNEIQIYKNIGQHSNIIELYSHEIHAKYPRQDNSNWNNVDCVILELEYCEFGSIMDANLFGIIHNNNYSFEQNRNIVRTYFKQLMNAINFCHDKDIIHRDLKPSNLLIDSKFRLKVSDFGISKVSNILKGKAVINDKSRRVGTRGFMAPEVLLGRHYDKSCDIFSCGVVLFYLLFGQKPFNNATIDDKNYNLIIQHKIDSFWNLHKLNENENKIDDESNNGSVQDLIGKMLEFNPELRIRGSRIMIHLWYDQESYSVEELYQIMQERVKIPNKNDQQTYKSKQNSIQTGVKTDFALTTNVDFTVHPSGWHDQSVKYIEDPLIIIIGCGNYDTDDLKNLIGVKTDYKRIINAFYKTYGYSIVYKIDKENDESKENDTIYLTKDKKLSHTNSSKSLSSKKNNYKIYWTGNNIRDFLEEARDDYLIPNKHDSLILILSGHGKKEAMFTSDGGRFPHRKFLEPFSDENNMFISMPKIGIFDMCRGNQKPFIPKPKPNSKKETTIQGTLFKGKIKNQDETEMQLVDIVNNNNNSNITIASNNSEESSDVKIGHESDVSGTVSVNLVYRGTQLKDDNNNANTDDNKQNNDNTDGHNNEAGDFHLWRRIYANPDGYAAIDGKNKGGYLIHGLCNTLLDKHNVVTRDLDDIINQVRIKTRKLAGKYLTEIVEDVKDIHYKIVFKSKK